MLVLDASTTLAWYFADEASPAAEALLDRVRDRGAVVPAIWKLEVANSLQSAKRRRRISTEYRDDSLRDLARLPITMDAETNDHAWRRTVRISDDFGLSAYDAAYLELAVRTNLPLATFDGGLRRAAERAGVPLAA